MSLYLCLKYGYEFMIENQLLNYTQWLKSYPWEVMITTRLHGVRASNLHDAIIADVLRPAAKFIKSTVAAITIVIPASDRVQPHAHSLLMSKSKELIYQSPELLHYIARHTPRNAVDLQPVFSDEVAGYAARNIIIDHGEIHYYNKRLLCALKKGDLK